MTDIEMPLFRLHLVSCAQNIHARHINFSIDIRCKDANDADLIGSRKSREPNSTWEFLYSEQIS